MALLEIRNMSVQFGAENAPFMAVDGLDLNIDQGQVVGIVGESGSGKSVTSLALMGLIDYPGRVDAERMAFDGRDLLKMPEGIFQPRDSGTGLELRYEQSVPWLRLIVDSASMTEQQTAEKYFSVAC